MTAAHTPDNVSNGNVRVIALVGPTGAGKSTLANALKAVSQGQTLSTTMPGQTMELGVTPIDHLGDHYVLLDMPGAVDFCADMDYALPAVDLALIVVDADPDKAILAQPFIKQCEDASVPHALFINKIDQADGSGRDILEAFQPISAAPLVARQLPIWRDGKVTGFVDLALERAFVYRTGKPSELTNIPREIAQIEADARFHMLEQLADFDDALMEQLLSDAQPSPQAIFGDIVRETQESLIVPVFFGAATQGYGLRRLLKALRHDTPKPNIAAARLDVSNGVYVLKTSHAGQAGKLAFARVFGAPLADHAELTLSNGARGRAGALFALNGGAPRKITTAPIGDVVAIGKIDPVSRGDILPASGAASRANVTPRQSVFQIAIATTDRKDDVRLSGALAKLLDEDNGLSVVHDASTNEILLHGQGEPHLRHVLDALKKRFNVDVTQAKPTTPYRETIRRPAKQHGRHKKQTGGHGQFADVQIEIAPLPRGSGFKFVDKITGGAVPRQWIPAVEQGIRDAMEKGPLGHPVVDIEVTLVDGAFHAVDSSELAFRIAGRLAMSEALPGCEPVMLDPIEKLSVFTPNWGTPKINSAVASRNGHILGFEARDGWPGWDRIDIHLSQAERLNFIIELRSLTQGLATFTSEFSHMIELGGKRAEDVARKAKQVA